MTNRHEFRKAGKLVLAKRAQFTCSFPGCGVFTTGPGPDSTSAATIGVAAHIQAAAPGGKRFNRAMSEQQRSHIDNGIWLCQTHATLIDQDESIYTAEKIRKWKIDHETRAITRLHAGLKGDDSQEKIDVSWAFYSKEPWDLALSTNLPEPPLQLNSGFVPYDWLMQHGAGQYLETQIKVFIANNTGATLVVSDIKVNSQTTSPFNGALVHCDTAGSRAMEVFVFDLEKPDPRPMRANFEDGDIQLSSSTDFFRSEFLCIPSGDVQGLTIIGRVKTKMAKWQFEICTLVNGKTGTRIIDNHGGPFITTGVPEKGFLQRYDWEWYLGEERQFKQLK